MKAVGIVSEFNPFHQGHEYLISKVKDQFPDHAIVCVMSGNFVQRGEFAILEKYSRARLAVLGGADLVLELPYPFSSLSAESFGRSAVSILHRIGVCDTLAFGTEIAEEDRLLSCADNLMSPVFLSALDTYLAEHRGMGFPLARQRVYESLFGEEKILASSNASLALEYIIAAKKMNAPFIFYPVKRVGDKIRSQTLTSSFPSATAIRRGIKEGREEIPLPEYVKEEMAKERQAGRFPVTIDRLWDVLSYQIKTRSHQELSRIYGFSPLLHRAKRYEPESRSVEELVEKMKNATFTDSRIRRSLLALICQTPRFAEKEEVAFTQVLAASGKGRDVLSQMRGESTIPVFTKPADVLRDEDVRVKSQGERLALADEIFAMAFEKKVEKGFFIKKKPTIF